jgi:phosphatidylserine synthase
VAEEAHATSLAFLDSVIDLSFSVMPLIVGFAARLGESLPFLVCALFLASAGALFQLQRGSAPVNTDWAQDQV